MLGTLCPLTSKWPWGRGRSVWQLGAECQGVQREQTQSPTLQSRTTPFFKASELFVCVYQNTPRTDTLSAVSTRDSLFPLLDLRAW